MVHSLIQTINLIVPNLSELDAVCGNKLEVRADAKDTRAPESLDTWRQCRAVSRIAPTSYILYIIHCRRRHSAQASFCRDTRCGGEVALPCLAEKKCECNYWGKERITGEFPEVRSDKKKPREDRQNHRYHRSVRREKERKRCPGSIITNLHSIHKKNTCILAKKKCLREPLIDHRHYIIES